MSVGLSLCIQAVPERRAHVERCLISLMEPSVSPDWFADCDTFYDHEHLGPLFGMQGAIAAVLAVDAAVTHVILLEDDVILCRDFLRGVKEAVSAQPTLPLHLSYLGSLKRAKPEAHFVQLSAWWGTQAYVLPRALAERFLAFCADPDSKLVIRAIGRAQPDFVPQEEHIAWQLASDVWLRFGLEVLGSPMWHTVPSLAAHAAPDTTSLRRGPISESELALRHSPWFIGSEVSALKVDWEEQSAGGLVLP